MRFAPKTEEELQTMSLLAPGIYKFQVSSAKDEISKSGNEMIKLMLGVWDENGSLHFIYDYLLEAMGQKLRNFCEVSGLIDKYEHGEIGAEDCVNRQGFVEIIVQEGKMKDNGDKYPMRNAIKNYIKKSEASSVVSNNLEGIDDDLIPF